jgi:hypothetical protein
MASPALRTRKGAGPKDEEVAPVPKVSFSIEIFY